MIDIGLNLTHESFNADREALLHAAAAADVTHMLVTGSTLASTQAAIDLAQRHPDALRATAGVHPHHAGDLRAQDLPELRRLALLPQVVAVGECGLDYFRDFSAHADQQQAFRWQLQLAVEVGKPLFLHQRDAHEDFLAILQEYWSSIRRGVAHCFTGGVAQAKAYLDLGLYLGITGWICDERRGAELREAIRHIPRDRLLVETDAPYLLPRDLRPKPSSRRNEPKYLPHIVEIVARLRGETPEEVAAYMADNARELFGWPQFGVANADKETATRA